MSSFLFRIGDRTPKPSGWNRFLAELTDALWSRRLDSGLGYLLFMVLAFLVAVLFGASSPAEAMGWLGGMLAVFALGGALFHLRFGLYMLLIVGGVLLGIKRYVPEVPIGIFVDATVLVLLFGLLIKQIRQRDWRLLMHPLSLAVMAWIAYCLFEYLNPLPDSKLPWFYTVRHMAGHMLIFFVALYAFQRRQHLKVLLLIWVGLATLGALYGLYQEFFGLSEFERDWVMGDPERFSLFYTWNRYRVFSIFSDPTVFGIMMAFSSIMCLVFAFDPKRPRYQQVLLFLCAGLMAWALIYSGTRTAVVVWVAGFVFFGLVSLQRSVLILLGSAAMVGLALYWIPTENPHLLRLKSAFAPTESASYQIREQNQGYIQPIIQSLPLGAGLGTTGIWGRRFAPDTMLSQFPPDSGYVRIAVETGWVGLLLYCGLMALILWTGVRGYFAAQSPRIRRYYLAFLSLVFVMVLAHYPQQAITQLPNSLMFYLAMAALVKLKDFDQAAGSTIKEQNVTV